MRFRNLNEVRRRDMHFTQKRFLPRESKIICKGDVFKQHERSIARLYASVFSQYRITNRFSLAVQIFPRKVAEEMDR